MFLHGFISWIFPKQLSVGVLNAFLVCRWDDVSAPLVLSFSWLRSCLPACPPSGLGCCVRLFGFLLSPALPPACVPAGLRCCAASLTLFLSSLQSCLPACLLDAVSASLVFSSCFSACFLCGLGCCVCLLILSFSCLWPCLPSCLPSGLGCCVRLLGLVFLPMQFAVGVLNVCLVGLPCLECCVRLAGFVFFLSPTWSPTLSSSWSGMLCPASWACRLGCCVRVLGLSAKLVSHLVFQLVWDAVSLLVSKISCAICSAVWGLWWCNFSSCFFIFVVLFFFQNYKKHGSFRHQSLTIATWFKVLQGTFTKREPPKSVYYRMSSRFPMWSWFLLAILTAVLAKREEEDVMMVQRQGTVLTHE